MMKHEKFYGRGGAALPCANDEGDPVIMAFKYEITERIAVLSTNSSGWERQLNLISWNDHEPKYDIRDWSPDGSKMGKGISMTKEDLIALKGILDDMELGWKIIAHNLLTFTTRMSPAPVRTAC